MSVPMSIHKSVHMSIHMSVHMLIQIYVHILYTCLYNCLYTRRARFQTDVFTQANPTYTATELTHQLQSSGATYIITIPSFVEMAKGCATEVVNHN